MFVRSFRSSARSQAAPASRIVAGLLALALLFPSARTLHGQGKPDATPGPKWALTANLLQLMRGLYFPTSNMIFNVQSNDPAKKKPQTKSADGGAGFDFFEWGNNLYPGWEYVDYAASILAEASPLLLTPGRMCSNGKPVPVDRPDWVQYTMGMMEAARKTYALALTRNQEAVADSTENLTDACTACHRIYRDRRAPGKPIGDPANLALRCTPP